VLRNENILTSAGEFPSSIFGKLADWFSAIKGHQKPTSISSATCPLANNLCRVTSAISWSDVYITLCLSEKFKCCTVWALDSFFLTI